MLNVENYISELISGLRIQFGSRLVYVGLQGSYMRGEATENSDIDVMVIIEDMTISDLDSYRNIIRSLESPEKSCGFICSKADLANWNPLEICHLINSTRDCFGRLAELVPEFSRQDVENYVKLSINNLYHEICHRFIHADAAKSVSHLPGTYKSVFFILQNLHYLRTEVFAATKAELLSLLEGMDREVLKRSIELNQGKLFDFSESFELLFTWCQSTIKAL